MSIGQSIVYAPKNAPPRRRPSHWRHAGAFGHREETQALPASTYCKVGKGPNRARIPQDADPLLVVCLSNIHTIHTTIRERNFLFVVLFFLARPQVSPSREERKAGARNDTGRSNSRVICSPVAAEPEHILSKRADPAALRKPLQARAKEAKSSLKLRNWAM